MNVKEYISSGIVELYAMNALSPEDKKEFEQMGLLYPEVGEELRKVEKKLEGYALSHPLNPRPILREKILSNLIKNGDSVKEAPPKKDIDDGDHSLTYKYLIAASLAALVISTFASWFFYTRWNDAEERYTTLLKEKNDLAVNFNVVKATYDETLANLLIIRDELSEVYSLHSTDTAHNYQARVYWNKFNLHTYIDVLSLPVPPEGMQYQLWAFVKWKSFDAGTLHSETRSIERAKDIANADSWMITLEPKGGSPTPTMDRVYLKNK